MNIIAMKLAAIAAIASGAATAADVVPLAYSEIVKQAELIAVGTAARVESRFEEGGKTIRTYVTFRDLTIHKGAVRGALQLRFEGGQVGREGLRVSGMPQLRADSRYLLFVDGNGKKLSPIVGYNQGIFELRRVADREVLVNVHGLEWIGVSDDRLVFAGKPAPVRGEAPQALPVPGFRPEPAHPDSERLEREARSRRTADASPVVREAPAGPPSPAPAEPASPPPTPSDVRPAAAAKAPLVVPATSDPGRRISLSEALTLTRRVR